MRMTSTGLDEFDEITFYKASSLVLKVQHMITLCRGEELINIGPGDTTSDSKCSLETVNCLDCRALGSVMVVDGGYHGCLSPGQAKGVLENCE